MDKYTKSFLMVFKIPIGIFCILVGLASLGISIWTSTISVISSMILLIGLLAGVVLINYGIGYAFLGDEYEATDIVHNGETTFAPVETPKFLKRRKIVTFIGFISYILLSIYYVVILILDIIYKSHFENFHFDSDMIALIIFAVVALIFAFFFMIYKKTKHIDLKEK